MNKLILIILSLFTISAYSKCSDAPVIIAVVDSGFGYEGLGKEARLCKYGHKDFTTTGPKTLHPWPFEAVPPDYMGHGTNIVGIIDGYARKAHINYCILVLKYYEKGSNNTLKPTIAAFNYATRIGIKYINYSSGGEVPDERENVAVKKFLDQGGTMVVAAGNDGKNLDLPGNHRYPAEYDKRIVTVGMLFTDGVKHSRSNYGGPVNRWEMGYKINAYGITSSGTSQAAAVAMGKIISQNPNKCDVGN